MAKPDIEINVGPKRFVVTATPLLPDDPDCPRLWEIVKKEQRQPLQELSEAYVAADTSHRLTP